MQYMGLSKIQEDKYKDIRSFQRFSYTSTSSLQTVPSTCTNTSSFQPQLSLSHDWVFQQEVNSLLIVRRTG